MRADPLKRAEGLADSVTGTLPHLTKPLAIVARTPVQAEGFAAAVAFQDRVSRAGLAVFPSIVRAAGALGHLLEWQQSRRDLVMP